MQDRFGRKIEYLRVSVTQNCNLKCIYCTPSGDQPQGGSCASLSPVEFERLVRPMAELGIRKVRITGGEPLTRRDICEIISRIAGIPGIKDLSMTTNGIGLYELADDLKAAGLMRLNISLDSLDAGRFAHITGGGKLESVVKGIEKAVSIGLAPVKLNTVLIKGVNDQEVGVFMELAKDSPLDIRFIELMPIGRYGEDNTDKILYHRDILAAHPELEPCMDREEGQPARYYRIHGYQGRIGFISPMSHKFCDRCNRIRLTCDGKLKPCLGDNGEINVVELLRNHPEKLHDFLQDIIYNKPEGHTFEESFRSLRPMQGIGG
jgi:GTP 3',8-cyclase